MLPCGGNDVWVVADPSGKSVDLLLPALKTVVREVDTANKKITVALPAGLREIYSEQEKPAEKHEDFED